MAGKDTIRNMQLANVSANFDDMLGYMKSRFDGKTWDKGKARIGMHPEYVEKEWLRIAIDKKKVVTIETDESGLQVFKFNE